MTKQHREVLAKLDPLAVARYQITEKDIWTIDRYLKIIQAKLVGASLWREIVEFPSAYGTSLAVQKGMKVRRLQQLIAENTWEDHGYAYEREDGSCAFSYNTLVWGRIGAEYNHQLQTTGTKLEAVHTVIPTGDQLRWLEIEEIKGDPEEIKANLDKACQIPRPRPKPVVA